MQNIILLTILATASSILLFIEACITTDAARYGKLTWWGWWAVQLWGFTVVFSMWAGVVHLAQPQ
jgi:hypothetical protein